MSNNDYSYEKRTSNRTKSLYPFWTLELTIISVLLHSVYSEKTFLGRHHLSQITNLLSSRPYGTVNYIDWWHLHLRTC